MTKTETKRWRSRRSRRLPTKQAGAVCRACNDRAQLHLVAPSGVYEMLCYEHLGEFLNIWTDHAIREWTVVRL